MKKKSGYLAVILDQESRQKLVAIAVHKTESDVEKFSHHLTICFKPDAKTWNKFSDMLGKTVELVVVGIACDDKAQAVYIPATKSEKKFPHITVSCADGVKPVYSNSLLEACDASGTIEPLEMLLKGTVLFVEL